MAKCVSSSSCLSSLSRIWCLFCLDFAGRVGLMCCGILLFCSVCQLFSALACSYIRTVIARRDYFSRSSSVCDLCCFLVRGKIPNCLDQVIERDEAVTIPFSGHEEFVASKWNWYLTSFDRKITSVNFVAERRFAAAENNNWLQHLKQSFHSIHSYMYLVS